MQGRPGFLTPWLVLTTISMVFQVLNVLGGLIALEWGKTFSTIIGLVITKAIFSKRRKSTVAYILRSFD